MMKAYWLVFAVYPLTLSPLHAQGGFSSNPYCAQYSDGASLDCSFSTLSQCYQSVTGVGGICINNPRAGVTPPAGNSQYAFSPSLLPPPPIQQPQGPMQLPGLPPPQQPQQQSQGGLPPPPPPACNPLFDGTYCASAGAPAQSLSSDLSGGGEPSATLGGATFSGNTDCIGILRPMSCGS
jgi:Protein of unknown function (DUF3551)